VDKLGGGTAVEDEVCAAEMFGGDEIHCTLGDYGYVSATP
jgi:hypothetical protein